MFQICNLISAFAGGRRHRDIKDFYVLGLSLAWYIYNWSGPRRQLGMFSLGKLWYHLCEIIKTQGASGVEQGIRKRHQSICHSLHLQLSGVGTKIVTRNTSRTSLGIPILNAEKEITTLNIGMDDIQFLKTGCHSMVIKS